MLNSSSKSSGQLVAESDDGRTPPHQFAPLRRSRSTRQATRTRVASECKTTTSTGLVQREAWSDVGSSAVVRQTQEVANDDVSRPEGEGREVAGMVVDDDDDDDVETRRRRRTTKQASKASGTSISSETELSVQPRSEHGPSRCLVATSTGPTTRSKRRALEEPHQCISKIKRVRHTVPVDDMPGPSDFSQQRYEQPMAYQRTERRSRAVNNKNKSPSPVLDAQLAQRGGRRKNQAIPSVANDDAEDDEGEGDEDDEGEGDEEDEGEGDEEDEEGGDEEYEEAEAEDDLEYDTISSNSTDRSGSEGIDSPLQPIADEMREWLRDMHPLSSKIITSVVETIDQVENAYEPTIARGDFIHVEREIHRLDGIIKGLKSEIKTGQDILDLYGYAIPKLVRLLSRTDRHPTAHRGRIQMVFVVACLIERCYSLASRWAPRPAPAVHLARSIRDKVLPPVRSLIEDVERKLVRKIRRSSNAKYRQRLKRRIGKVMEVPHRNDTRRVAAGHRTMVSQLERIETLAGPFQHRNRHSESLTSSSSSTEWSGPRKDPGRQVNPRYGSSYETHAKPLTTILD